MLKGLAEGLVNLLGLVVTLGLLAGLLLETEALLRGNVQLSVGVANLLGADESLETLAETGSSTVALGKRRHHLGVADNEGRADALRLEVLAGKSINHTGAGKGRAALNAGLGKDLLEELDALVSVELIGRRELLASAFLEGGNHGDTAPGALPVDLKLLALGVVVLGDVGAVDVLDQARNELLSHVHEVVHVSVSHIELEGGEFYQSVSIGLFVVYTYTLARLTRVVSQINAFVTELTAHLVDTVETTDNKHLEVQLGGNTQEHVHVEIVVVGNEGLGSGTASNDVEHGGLDRDEVAVVEPAANVRVDLGAGDEDIAGLVVHHEIEVTLAETLLVVLEAVVVIRDLVQARRQKDNLGGSNGKLAREFTLTLLVLGVGTGRETLDTNDVTTAKVDVLLVESGSVLADKVRLSEDLESGALDILLASGTCLVTCDLPTYIRADIVEVELGASRALDVYSATKGNLLGLVALTVLEVREFLFKVADVVVDVELEMMLASC